MKSPDASRLVAHPAQVAETETGVVLKRGCAEIRLRGRGVQAVLQQLLAPRPGGLTVEELVEPFDVAQRPLAKQLVGLLLERRFLTPSGDGGEPLQVEHPGDVFLWDMHVDRVELTSALRGKKVTVLGVNAVADNLVQALHASGLESVEVVDEPLLTSQRFRGPDGRLARSTWRCGLEPIDALVFRERLSSEAPACLVATSELGGLQALRPYNAMAVARGVPFLSVVLRNLVGYVGPYVIPHETACFECFYARWHSHVESAERQAAMELDAAQSPEAAVVGFHPSMPVVLGHVAGLELLKVLSRALPAWQVGKVLEVNLLAATMKSHAVLKVPRCSVCSGLVRVPASALTPLET